MVSVLKISVLHSFASKLDRSHRLPSSGHTELSYELRRPKYVVIPKILRARARNLLAALAAPTEQQISRPTIIFSSFAFPLIHFLIVDRHRPHFTRAIYSLAISVLIWLKSLLYFSLSGDLTEAAVDSRNRPGGGEGLGPRRPCTLPSPDPS
jgi:hypothetical protein